MSVDAKYIRLNSIHVIYFECDHGHEMRAKPLGQKRINFSARKYFQLKSTVSGWQKKIELFCNPCVVV